MRIVHVAQRFHPDVGGAETHVAALAREQARRGHDVTVVTSLPVGGAPRTERHAGHGIVRLPARRFRGDYLVPPWLPMRGAEDAILDLRPDVIHAHAYRFATIEHAAAAARRASVPLVVTAHGFYPPENLVVALSRKIYDAARGRRALAAAARCVAVTRHEIAHYEALGVPPDRIEVVPNGIDASAFDPGQGKRFRERHGLAGDVVLFLARLAHDKGLPDLVASMPAILRERPDATLAVCGRDAGALGVARALARRLDIEARVRFLGPVPDPREAYAACDVFVLPSHYEAFGLVLLEAMAQERAVVATTAGGMPEVVGDAGVVVPPRAPDALAREVAALLADPPRRDALAARGKERARTFLWTDVVDRLEETYARALRG